MDITAQDLKAKFENNEDFFLLDVREPWEIEVSKIEGSYSIPLGELGPRLQEVPKNKCIVVYCASGGRSSVAMNALLANGYVSVYNLRGGIGAWMK